ncbi:hypothetical protein [Gaoshiqia sp. Z1-71]|uniref:hypothetical protein n=1 Tax=Gaoshiqia hydrogeniformans TaxID=3290090 RepID=UPI003BF7AEF2
MSGLNRKQAKLLKKQVGKLYGRNYIPLMTGDSTLSIGDILLSKHDILPILDSSVFDPVNTEIVEGKKTSKNVTSDSGVKLTAKFRGEAILSEYFKLDEAGIVVQFSSDDQMFLKIQGMRQQSIKNFISFRQELLERYVNGQISSKVYVVRGLVYADKYYLQFSGSQGGTVGFQIDADVKYLDAEVEADFNIKWKKEVGYHIDGSTGGVLAYCVSGVRLKKQLMPAGIQEKIRNGMSESDALECLSVSERQDLLSKDALEIVDLTDEILLAPEKTE